MILIIVDMSVVVKSVYALLKKIRSETKTEKCLEANINIKGTSILHYQSFKLWNKIDTVFSINIL